ncbi:MAG: DUF4372 domain-containing protein [Bacteroidaceae bacterium]|nr:DUF4372 domain-containing protein [Bacteroidaceae bacterium]
MHKCTHFSVQSNKITKSKKYVEISKKHGGGRYVKSIDGYTHLLSMHYAVISRFDSLHLPYKGRGSTVTRL